jgi:1,2-diacylglycerol 3-beta-galactosyltransferase
LSDHRLDLRVPLLFLMSDTGGGHRSAAQAVVDALELVYPGRFAPILCDPLAGEGAPRLVRRVTRLYGPLTRRAPRVWGAIYGASDSERAVSALERTLFAGVDRRVTGVISEVNPAVVVSFHALTTAPAARAARAARRTPQSPPVVSVVTDLVTVHKAWCCGDVDYVVAPSPPVAWRFYAGGTTSDRLVETGLPVGPELSSGPLADSDRAALRRVLGLGETTFVVLATGGVEGSGRLGRQVRALVGSCPNNVEVVAICGRNRALERKLRRFCRRSGTTRLMVKGHVSNMADWLRCADVVVTKAGPGTLAEAACAGAALIVTSHLPGQEAGNTELVVAAGAALYAPTVRDLVRAVERLHDDPAALRAMREASGRLGRPQAATAVASLLAALALPGCDRLEAVYPDVVLT